MIFRITTTTGLDRSGPHLTDSLYHWTAKIGGETTENKRKRKSKGQIKYFLITRIP